MFFKLFAILTVCHSVASIFNGSPAKSHQFPYIVLLNSPRFYCAGTLISPSHVLTAAHCLSSIRKGSSVKVSLGAHEYYGNSKSDGTLILADKFWIHENFSMPSAIHDIGLIELPKPIEVSRVTRFIGVETKANVDKNFNEQFVTLAGWGHSSPGRHSKVLRYTTMKLLPLNVCVNYKQNYIESLTENHICAEKVDNLPCDGDSGTSLVSLRSGKVIGVLSYVKDAENGEDMGYNDCISRVPAIATRISNYLDWIYQKSGLKF